MKAEIKYIYSPNIENLETHIPNEKDNFCFLLQVFVGIEDKEGEESFNFEICTPKWLLDNLKKDEIIMGKNYIIVLEYNYEKLLQEIKTLINKCTGKSWNEIALKLSCFSRWEFEDYYEI